MTTSPMMQQYAEAKTACGDAILLFRMGDFYELFHEDARTAASILGLTLTSRDKNTNPTPMAGFPHHQLEGYLGKLIRAGFRVAVCDQVENPATAKGLVRREVTRVVTPGTAIEDEILEPREPNYLTSIKLGKADRAGRVPVGLSWLDLSTGIFFATITSEPKLASEIGRIAPKELLVSENELSHLSAVDPDIMRTTRPQWTYTPANTQTVLKDHFQTLGMDGFGFGDEDQLALQAAGGLLAYLRETQKYSLSHIDRLSPYRSGQCLEIDNATRRSLELTATLRSGNRAGSLLSVLDQCVTNMGSRVMVEWLNNPLTDQTHIEQRLDAVQVFLENERLTQDLGKLLGEVFDLERMAGKVSAGRATPRDLANIARTLEKLPEIKAKIADYDSDLLESLHQNLELFEELRDALLTALADECPLTLKDGGFIRDGFHQQLDQLRALAAGGKDWIASYQASIIETSGIPSLKVGYNRVFGYYLEVTNTHRDRIPESFIRKQTLKNAERYITPELKEYEEKILTADEQANTLEVQLFEELRQQVASQGNRLRSTARILAQLDALRSLGTLATRNRYTRPKLSQERILKIDGGRHPVLDAQAKDVAFVANDTLLDDETGFIALITGPNMAGKSTYIRQVALITLMAQIGSFVPADHAELGIADRIFARVGASDELSRGQSTFMVEMIETAHILNNATDRSLVILDEIGRGTSTYDGVSLAWAIVEHLHDQLGARTLFATHYHELTDLANLLPHVKNLTVLVREWDEKIVFLHQIVPGATDKSYGIQVARLAGVPGSVNERAKEVLAKLESEFLTPENRPKLSQRVGDHKPIQLTFFGPAHHPLIDTIRDLDVQTLTPVQCLNLIHQWHQRIQEEAQ